MRSVDQALVTALEALPPGWAYARDPLSVIGRTLTPLAGEVAVFEARAEALLVESTPVSADALLSDYERVLGPDPCLAPAPTLGERRMSVSARWTSRGGASRRRYIALAAALGYTITIDEFRPSTYGITRYGDRYADAGWAHVWRINVLNTTVRYAQYGSAAYGDRYLTFGSTLLECVMSRAQPAHTRLIFGYPGGGTKAGFGSFVFGRDSLA